MINASLKTAIIVLHFAFNTNWNGDTFSIRKIREWGRNYIGKLMQVFFVHRQKTDETIKTIILMMVAKTWCCNVWTNSKIKSLSSMSIGSQDRTVFYEKKLRRTTASIMTLCLTYVSSRMTGIKTFHSEYKKKKKKIRYSNKIQ